MRKQQFPKFSTIGLDERWWRADIGPSDLRWAQHNLRSWADAQRAFGIKAKGTSLTRVGLYPDMPWSDRVVFVEGEYAPRVLLPLGKEFNYREAYSRSRRQHDPYLSPHGLFRNLEPGNHRHAFQFMQEFGPLFIESDTSIPGEAIWINLSDFWQRHARFLAVTKLWEDRFDPDKLAANWADMAEHYEDLNRGGDAPLGFIPDATYKYIRLCQNLPWERVSCEKEAFQLPNISRQLVYDLVHSELILHTQNCVQTWGRRMVPHDEFVWDETFEPTRSFTSLFSAIWELFGLDTRQYGWKICRLCGRLFYPKDRRSVCCSTTHQSLWSKRQWAQEHRVLNRLRKSVDSKDVSTSKRKSGLKSAAGQEAGTDTRTRGEKSKAANQKDRTRVRDKR